VLVAEYLSRFQLDIRYKPSKLNIVPDALSRLPILYIEDKLETVPKEGELDTIHTETFTISSYIEISQEIHDTIIVGYYLDLKFVSILKIVKSNTKLGVNTVNLPFVV
jgi:hypothetical protein